MPEAALRENCLVLYKKKPGIVKRIGKKVEVEVESGRLLKLRPKDVTLLHPGPVRALSELAIQTGEMETAWELLAGENTNLSELSELAYGEYTPATAWAAWQRVANGLYFSGQPDEIKAHLPETVANERAVRAAKAAEKQAWSDFIGRVRENGYLPQDERYLQNVAAVALGEHQRDPVLRELGQTENPQNAHALLLNLGYWDVAVNPYPRREGVSTTPPELPLPELPAETRRDLTHLQAFAIDDQGSRDPDDAISIENGRLWVHIADVATLVPPNSPADLEAQARGANLYLPEGTVPMLPFSATAELALGLNETSPALSFGMNVNGVGELSELEIVPSWVRVARMTYAEAEARLDESPFQELLTITQTYEKRRLQNGAVHIELPEVKIRVRQGQVDIQPLAPLRSRDLVRETMLMVGEAVARYAVENEIPVPFAGQPPPEIESQAVSETPAAMFALRRTLKRGQQHSTPTPHSGLGMALYTRSTSPLRRYLDLVTHQQLRAHLRGEAELDIQAMMERVGAAGAVAGNVRRAERLSNIHWTLVYLLQHPGWRGEGIIVDKRGSRALALIPALALETPLYSRSDLPLDSSVSLVLDEVNLAEQQARFRLSS
jgi:exoribonuclease-2